MWGPESGVIGVEIVFVGERVVVRRDVTIFTISMPEGAAEGQRD